MQAGCFLPENLDIYAAAIDFREQMTLRMPENISQVDRGDASDPLNIGLSKKASRQSQPIPPMRRQIDLIKTGSNE